MKNIQDYFDTYGLIVHRFPSGDDQGDSAQRTCSFYYALSVYKRLNIPGYYSNAPLTAFIFALLKLELIPGWYRRHPDKPYNDIHDFSRDQWVPLICALGAYGMTTKAWSLFVEQIKRFGKFQNKDIMTWEVIAYIRAMKLWPLWPVLFWLDLGLLLNSIIRVTISFFSKDNVGDDLNHTHLLVQSWLVLDTPFAWLARKIFKLRRMSHTNAENTILSAWAHYYRHDSAPPLDVVWAPIIKKVF